MARKNKKKRSLRPSIAVIGEGATEWFYFDSYRKNERPWFSLKPEKPKHSSDINSIKLKIDSLQSEYYDYIFCVIDLDRIVCDSTEKNKYEKLKNRYHKNKNIVFVENMPCFEIWFLLHFVKSSKTFNTYNELLPELKKHILNYEKTKSYFIKNDLYLKLKDKLDTAINNSIALTENDDCDSKSEMYLIFQKLNSLKNGK